MFWRKEHEETEKFFKYVLQHKPFIVYDLETTGKNSTVDRIVQFSANRYEVIAGKYTLTDSINLYIRPPFLMSQDVINVHGITNEFLADKEDESEVFPKIRQFIEQRGSIICGYNIVKFDNKFLEKLYERNCTPFPILETVDIYLSVKEVVYPNDVKEELEKKFGSDSEISGKDLRSLKLSNLVAYFHIDEEFDFHSAEEDIAATWRCGTELLKKFKTDFGIRKGIRIPWEEKEQVRILEITLFKKSSTVNRLYVTVQRQDGSKVKIYYDIRLKGWVDTDGSIIRSIDMETLNHDAEVISRNMGFQTLEKFTGHASGKDVCLETA